MEIEVLTADGFTLRGDASIHQDSAKVAVLFHGLTETRREYAGFYDHLRDAYVANDWSVVRLELRGHGESEGTDLDVGLVSSMLDAEALGNQLDDLMGKRPLTLCVVGTSFGAAAAIRLAQLRNAHRVCLLAPALDMEAVLLEGATNTAREFYNDETLAKSRTTGYLTFGDNFRISSRFLLEMRFLKLYSALNSLDAQIVIAHGEKDEIVPISISKNARRKNRKIKLRTFSHMDHGYIDFGDDAGSTRKSAENLKEISQLFVGT